MGSPGIGRGSVRMPPSPPRLPHTPPTLPVPDSVTS
jgi:hypothetical protein